MMQQEKHELWNKTDLVLNLQIYFLLIQCNLGQEINFLIYEMERIIHTQ